MYFMMLVRKTEIFWYWSEFAAFRAEIRFLTYSVTSSLSSIPTTGVSGKRVDRQIKQASKTTANVSKLDFFGDLMKESSEDNRGNSFMDCCELVHGRSASEEVRWTCWWLDLPHSLDIFVLPNGMAGKDRIFRRLNVLRKLKKFFNSILSFNPFGGKEQSKTICEIISG